MDVNKEHIPSENLKTDDDISIALELPENDHLFEKKKRLLQDMCHDPKGHITLKSSCTPEQLKDVLEIMHQKARIINLDEIDLYFGGADVSNLLGSNSPRNELEALNLVLKNIDYSISICKPETINVLQELRDATINLIHEFGKKVGEESRLITSSSCEKENALLQWGKSNGISMKLEIDYVEGAGRGATASENLKIGDIAIEIPESLIISEKLVLESDMFPVLEEIEGILPETMLLLWSMKERHNCNSKFKLYFDTLPAEFHTGLSFTVHAFMALDGTSLLEEIVQAKEHLRNQYEELFPFLSDNHPDVFPPEFYTWEQFLWACELWYSNSMKVMFNDGKLWTCLVPIAGFLNHSVVLEKFDEIEPIQESTEQRVRVSSCEYSLGRTGYQFSCPRLTCPHITRYGKMDPVTNSLKFPLSRPCNAGEECFLSYGNFSSSHLLTFYGFLPRQDNLYDVIPLDIDRALEEDCEAGGLNFLWNTHVVRGTWFSKNHGIFNYGLPPPLLDHLRKARGCTLQTETHDKLEIERKILIDLCSTSEGMLETLGETDFDDRETASWDVKLALDFKDLQRRIISSVIDSCNAGLKLLEYELGKPVV